MKMVPETGIEPVRPFSGKRRILSPRSRSLKNNWLREIQFRKFAQYAGRKANACAGLNIFAELLLRGKFMENITGDRFKSCPRNQSFAPSRRPRDSFVTNRRICHSANTSKFPRFLAAALLCALAISASAAEPAPKPAPCPAPPIAPPPSCTVEQPPNGEPLPPSEILRRRRAVQIIIQQLLLD